MKIYNFLNLILISAFMLTTASCANLGDSANDLGSGYVYRVDGDQHWIRGEDIMQYGVYPNVVEYKFDNDFILVIQEPTIEGYKRFLAQDLRFKYETMTSKTDTLKDNSYGKKFLESHLWTDSAIHASVIKEIKLNDSQDKFDRLNLIADSIVKFDQNIKNDFLRKRNYWIILKKKDIVLGPYSKLEYERQRNELKIPEILQLEE